MQLSIKEKMYKQKEVYKVLPLLLKKGYESFRIIMVNIFMVKMNCTKKICYTHLFKIQDNDLNKETSESLKTLRTTGGR